MIGTAVSLALIAILIFMVFSTKNEDKTATTPVFKSVKALISQNKLDEARKAMDKIAAENPDSGSIGKEYFEIASLYEKEKSLVKARDLYSLILENYQNIDNILEVQEKLGRLNVQILFSPIVTDKDVLYAVEPGDTLSSIAKKFDTTVDLIKTSNSLKTDMIRAHSRLKISKAKYSILVDKSQNLLTLFSDGSVFKVYRVATGENNCTPVGTFDIVNRIKDPVWYTQGAIVPAESPDNILGSRWLGISEPGYGIHGTVSPESMGKQATKGCIRMLNPDVEELYTIVPVGTKVTIVD